MNKSKTPRVDCRKCRHYFVTWNPDFPFGCRAMGFKSKRLPAYDVYENSSMPCQLFDAKAKTKKSADGRRRI